MSEIASQTQKGKRERENVKSSPRSFVRLRSSRASANVDPCVYSHFYHGERERDPAHIGDSQREREKIKQHDSACGRGEKKKGSRQEKSMDGTFL